MSVNLEQASSAALQSSKELLSASLTKSQQKQEGEMAIKLIQSVTTPEAVAAPVGNVGHQINIKV